MAKQNSDPIVSVIIPAFNAEGTIAETLRSALGQSLAEIEVIVVDDGSTDGTFIVCDAIASKDKRMRIVRQSNAGVAAARNHGIRIAKGAFIAPLDADDLWHERRLELHVDALNKAGDQTAVAYSPNVAIDAEGMVLYRTPIRKISGQVFRQHLTKNFVGNGSAMTVRAEALRATGGYASWLRDQGAEGCEDWLIQLQLAHAHLFICVPLHLIGYRRLPTAMSVDELRMLRSRLLMLDEVARRFGVSEDPLFRFQLYNTAGELFLRWLERDGPVKAFSVARGVVGGWAAMTVVPVIAAFRASKMVLVAARNRFQKRRMREQGRATFAEFSAALSRSLAS